MAYVPRFRHLFKILFRICDTQAAEGLFLEGSVEFDNGNHGDARLMFYYGTRLDSNFAGNFYNLAVVTEKQKGACGETIAAWTKYLEVAEKDPKQVEGDREKVRQHLQELKAQSGTR